MRADDLRVRTARHEQPQHLTLDAYAAGAPAPPFARPTEAINLLIKKVNRVGHGFRNFNNYRRRLLLHCGVARHPVPTARGEAVNDASSRSP